MTFCLDLNQGMGSGLWQSNRAEGNKTTIIGTMNPEPLVAWATQSKRYILRFGKSGARAVPAKER
jgi:hypothetical protein